MTIVDTRIENNTAIDQRGGGVVVYNGATLDMSGCIVRGNDATIFGGGIALWDTGPVTISESTIMENASPSGAGIAVVECATPPLIQIDHSIVAFNTGSEGLYWDGVGTLFLYVDDIYGNPGGDWSGNIASLASIPGNMSLRPRFCADLNPDDPLTLGSNSPCTAANNGAYGRVGARPEGCGVVTSIEDQETTPVVAAPAVRCWPNPFNPSTTFRIAPAPGRRLTLTVHDVAGRTVRTLLDGVPGSAAERAVVWDGRDDAGGEMGSGTYVYRLRRDDETLSGRLTLIR